MARVSIFLIVVALITGMVGCGGGTVSYTLSVVSTQGGTVTTPGEGTFPYSSGAVLHLVAEAQEGYSFVNWTGDVDTIADPNSATTTITMNGNYAITANFLAECDLTVDSTDGGGVTTPDEGTFTYAVGAVVDLVAEPDEGYSFINWTGDVDTIADPNSPSTTITMNDNYAITANFFQGQLIWDWHDLHAIRVNLSSSYLLMNDLDSNTDGYAERASATANNGKGWQPIGTSGSPFIGSFHGQGYDISDLFINRPGEDRVGLFGSVGSGGVIEDVGAVNVDVTGHDFVGGLFGFGGTITVNNSYSTGSVTGNEYVGGLMGYNWGTVSDSYSTGSVTGTYHNVGGLVGHNSGTVSNSYATGSVSVTGECYRVGGLVGHNHGTVSNSYATGSVTGDRYVGGLTGENRGTVSESYATGSVTANTGLAGGLVGENSDIVSNSYATGSVTGGQVVGGLVGSNPGGTVSNSFWDTQTSGQATSDGGTGKTTAEMKDIATFSGAAWDIIAVGGPTERNPAHIWNIVDDQTYPFLSWQS